jgi:hypothetical protein
MIPEGGFEMDMPRFQFGADECGEGPCVVYGLEGNPSPDCNEASETCPDEPTIAERVFCSCRCDADPPVMGPFCACPAGFACSVLAPPGSAIEIQGSYCIRETLLPGA